MRAWILGGILATVLLVQQVLAVESETVFKADQRTAHIALVHACQVTQYDCSGIDVPQVRTNLQMPAQGARGMYMGGGILWIDPDLLPIQRRLTIFHEVVHYLQFEAGRLNVVMTSRCVLEREAMEFTNLYVDLMGFGDQFKRDLLEWQMRYRC